MAITQLINSKGNAVKNQFIINDGDTVTFQSYKSKVATYNTVTKNLILYGGTWDYSNTTRKHFSAFIDAFTSYRYINKASFEKLIQGNEGIITI